MKKTRKLLAMLLVVALLTSLPVASFAADENKVSNALDFATLPATSTDKAVVAEFLTTSMAIKEVSNLIVEGNGDYKFVCTQGYAGEGYFVQKLEAGEGKVFAENAVLDLTYRITSADSVGYVRVQSSVDGVNYNTCTEFNEATGAGFSNEARKSA